MRNVRLVLVSLVAVASLAACSGDDGSDGDASASGSPSITLHTPSPGEDGPFHRTCTAEVTLTGAVEATWKGEATSSDEAGPTAYAIANGDDSLIVYAGKGDITTNANLTVDGATYTTTSDQGFDVAGNGTSAEVAADTKGVSGPGPHVSATFACGKGR